MTSDIPTAGHTWCTTKGTTSSTASSTNPAVIVTNYKSGKTWYRVWSDGWIEQGGYSTLTGSGYAALEVTLSKAFVDTNYTVLASACHPNTGDYTCSARGEPTSTTKITLRKNWTGTAANGAAYWYACGY